MPLKINLICIWHHHLVHCFPFCLKCKSNKGLLINTNLARQSGYRSFSNTTSNRLTHYSKQPTAHSFFQSNFLVEKIMFSLSFLCKKNASHIQNSPCKYSLNWKPFRHKEMECLPFLVVTTNIWYSILNLLRYFIQRNFSVR
jgi:hypothetical protein